ncbi:MAG: putative membrane protein, partial [Arenicella sp.]
AVVAGLIILAVIYAMAPKPNTPADATTSPDGSAAKVAFSQVISIVNERCSSCHASQPTQAGFAAPPKGIVYETPDQIKAQINIIHQQSVVLKAMPIGNLTGMTEQERQLIGQWYQQINLAGQ